MNNLSQVLSPSNTIKDALQVIQTNKEKIVLVVDENKKLVGTLTDGDIRRALLNDYSLSNQIETIINTSPIICTINDSKEKIIHIANSKQLHYIPIVDQNGILLGIENIDQLQKNNQKENLVVLMAGGLGSRLAPLTNETPKPLLKVGEKPILETIIENFAKYGFKKIILSVNYKADMIQDYFRDGSDFGIEIDYIFESKRLGTAGALSLLREKPNEPFFVMNSDLLTNVNFDHFLKTHTSSNAIASMCVREIETQIPYGVIELSQNKIVSIKEKPIQKSFVSAGIYVLHPDALRYIPHDEFYDMPTLFEKIIANNQEIAAYIHNGYWIDIGQVGDYKKANMIFGKDIL